MSLHLLFMALQDYRDKYHREPTSLRLTAIMYAWLRDRMRERGENWVPMLFNGIPCVLDKTLKDGFLFDPEGD
jgi:hypothetical protein